MRPLKAIASSGEIARVMLAVKAVLATHDSIPVLVFDEIDANIGGPGTFDPAMIATTIELETVNGSIAVRRQ